MKTEAVIYMTPGVSRSDGPLEQALGNLSARIFSSWIPCCILFYISHWLIIFVFMLRCLVKDIVINFNP